jgi:two-component system sensor histidine kinase HydH
MGPFEAAARAGTINTLIFIGFMGMAGMAFLLALFWANNSRIIKKMFQDTNTMASEIISRMPIGLIVNDPEGKVGLVNQATLSLSGLGTIDFKGKKLKDLTFGAFPEDEDLNGLEMELCFDGGLCSRLSLTSGKMVGLDGTFMGKVILMADVGEVGRLKAELAQKERLAALGSMAAGLAHEIRNPLGAIKGLTQHLLNQNKNEDEQQALEVMLVSVERLAGTITDFLEYARPTELKTAPLPLSPFLKKIHELIGHDAQSRQVLMELKLPETDLTIQADEGKLAQVLLNLYLNAIQAVGLNQDENSRKIIVTLSTAGNNLVMISFADNGPGFGKKQLAQPFEPYFTSKAEGSGLGLAIARKIIQAHQGQIQLSNQSQGGALITILLPTS